MKKLKGFSLISIVCLTAVLILTGCGTTPGGSPPPTPAPGTENQVLEVSQTKNSSRFASDIDINNELAILGAPGERLSPTSPPFFGAAYIFTQNNDTWSIQTRLVSPNIEDDGFGRTVAINNRFAAVGTPFGISSDGDRNGVVHIFENSPSGWSHSQTISYPETSVPMAGFGSSLAMNQDYLLIGAEDHEEAVTDGGQEAGIVFVYAYSNTLGEYQLIGRLTAPAPRIGDVFGENIAITGNTIAVGAPGVDQGGKNNNGVVYIYRVSGPSITLQQTLVASDTIDNLYFGSSLSFDEITGGVKRLVVGTNNIRVAGSTVNGAAYVFEAGPGTTNFSETAILRPSDGHSADGFGTSVAVVEDSILVGSPNQNSEGMDAGASYSFSFNGSSWVQNTKIVTTNAKPGDRFGRSVSLWGDHLLIGSAIGFNAKNINETDTTNENIVSAGAAFAYKRDNTTIWAYRQKLHAQDSNRPSTFYGSVLYTDGANLLVRHRKGADLFTHDPEGFSLQEVFTSVSNSTDFEIDPISVVLDGNQAAIVSKRINFLEASSSSFPTTPVTIIDIFSKNISTNLWSWDERLEPPVTGGFPFESTFNAQLALQDNTLVVGLPRQNTSTGIAYVYTRDTASGIWNRQTLDVGPSVEAGTGRRVAIDGDWIAVAQVPAVSHGPNPKGSVNLFLKQADGSYLETQTLASAGTHSNDFFGKEMDMEGSLLAIYDDKPSGDSVRVYQRTGTNYSEIWSSAGEAWGIKMDGDNLAIGRGQEVLVFEQQTDNTFTRIETYSIENLTVGSFSKKPLGFNSQFIFVGGGADPSKVLVFNR